MKKILFCSLLLAMCIVSCKHIETPVAQDGVGTLSFALTDMADYIVVETKGNAGTDYTDFSNYDVVINGPTKVSEKYSEFSGRLVELGSGHYTITITSPDTEPAAFDQPIYRVEEEFDIRAGEVTSLNLTLTPYNCKVTIELSDNFVKELKTYEVVIGNGLAELVWTKDEVKNDFADNKAGYFLARGLEVKVKGHRSIDDTEATAVYYVKNPQPGDHHIIKLDAKVTGTIEGIVINRVTDFNEVSNDIEIGGMDESYVDRPDFGDDDSAGEEDEAKNEIIWAAHPDFSPLEITSDTEISMLIKMPAGIETFIVRVSDNFKDAIKEITHERRDYMDLINDPVIHETFGGDNSALPTGDEIYHQKEVLFDLTSFVPLLCQTCSGLTVDFILEATDVNNNELYLFDDYPTITLKIN